jgi:hypothetical protein
MEYFSSEIEIFSTFVKMFDFKELSEIVREDVMPRFGEYIWDHFYDQVWENENR